MDNDYDDDMMMLLLMMMTRYCGTVDLPKNMKGLLSPKSSIGRVDLLVRGVVDGIGLYDTIPGGSSRSLWLEITPRSFNVRIKEGLALTQLMVFRTCEAEEEEEELAGAPGNKQRGIASNSDTQTQADGVVSSAGEVDDVGSGGNATRLGQASQALIFDEHGNPLPHSWENGALVLCLSVPDVSSQSDNHGTIIGYEAIGTNEVIDLSRIRCHDWQKYFRRIAVRETPAVRRGSVDFSEEGSDSDGGGDSSPRPQSNNRRLTLEKDRFYILATKVCR